METAVAQSVLWLVYYWTWAEYFWISDKRASNMHIEGDAVDGGWVLQQT